MSRVLVVGGGAAGAALAARISEDPDREVVLVEAGRADGRFDAQAVQRLGTQAPCVSRVGPWLRERRPLK